MLEKEANTTASACVQVLRFLKLNRVLIVRSVAFSVAPKIGILNQ